MEQLINAIPALVSTLFGAVLSLLCTTIADNRRDKAERLRTIFHEKTKLYRQIGKFIVLETQNAENRMSRTYESVSTKQLVQDIEIDMQLFASKAVQKLFYAAYEAIEADLPNQVVISRLDTLGKAIRDDL